MGISVSVIFVIGAICLIIPLLSFLGAVIWDDLTAPSEYDEKIAEAKRQQADRKRAEEQLEWIKKNKFPPPLPPGA
jgi:hypothetical protein